MATTASRPHAEPWPSALRLATGLAQPGGAAMVRRALEGVGLEAGDRVVELAPGAGATAAIVLEREPREWTGVEPDPIAAEHLARAVKGPGREVVRAPVDATGLPDDAATVVLIEALLSTMEDGEAAAVLLEARRVLRPGGRVALIELAPAEGPADREVADDLAAAGVRPARSRRGAHSSRTRAWWSWARWRGGSRPRRRGSSCARRDRGRPCASRRRSPATAGCGRRSRPGARPSSGARSPSARPSSSPRCP